MKLKTEKISVSIEEPFKNDCLSREKYVGNLTTLLKNISSPIVVSINGAWGQGKTVFLEILNACLTKEGCYTVSFSAWETDFVDDPLLSFIGELNSQLDTYLGNDTKKRKAWSAAKATTKHIIKKGVPAALKIGTFGLLDAEKLVENEVSKIVASSSEDIIEKYSAERGAIEDFKNNLNALLKNENGSRDNLYILVDELDRCRPTYAIELLERIKHLFDIEGLVFVLALDKKQLSHSIQAVYGNNFNSKEYLLRFIDLEFQLPSNQKDTFIDMMYESYDFQSFFAKRLASNELRYDGDQLKDITSYLLEKEDFSLRRIEQFFSKINLVLRSTKENGYLHVPLLVFLMVLHETQHQIYLNYIEEGASPKEAIAYLKSYSDTIILEDNENPKALIEGYLIAGKTDRYRPREDVLLEQHKQIIASENVQDQNTASYSREVVDTAEYLIKVRRVSLPYVVSKIDFLGNFVFEQPQSPTAQSGVK